MAMHELILGGQKSGKSRCAEQRAAAWLAAAPGREALLVATATAGDDEMHARIAHHRTDRTARVPALGTLEESRALPQALATHSAAHRMLVVDCLTLWLTNLLMPAQREPLDGAAWAAQEQSLIDVLGRLPGPVVLVSNEIGFGVSPMTREARHFVDRLGGLHQRVAAQCARVTLLVAGIEVPVKGHQ